MNISDLKQILGSHATSAKKGFSQNFLYSDEMLERIASFVPKNAGFYIEIGGGVDDSMLKILNNRFGGKAEIKKEDATHLRFDNYFKEKRGAVFGNLPYSVSSPILFTTVQQSRFLNSAVFLLQKEVAEKTVSNPGEREFSPLAALINLTGSAELLFNIPPEAFFPAPKVWSSLIKIRFNEHDFSEDYLEKFGTIMKKIFSNRRKTLANVFKINQLPQSILDESAISPNARIEEISWETVLFIAKKLI